MTGRMPDLMQAQIICPFGTTVTPPKETSLVVADRAPQGPQVHFAPCVGKQCALFVPALTACALAVPAIALVNIDRAVSMLAEKLAPDTAKPKS